MKKMVFGVLAMLTVLSLLCAGALAKGGGPSGGGNQPQGNAQMQGGPMQGGPMQGGQFGMPGAQYGRFLDVEKLGEAVALMNEGDEKNNMIALMETYLEAVRNQDQTAVREALQAMTAEMAQEMDRLMEQTQLTEQDRERLRLFSQGCCLDTAAVAEAIAALDDADMAAALTALLQTYTAAVAAGDPPAIQAAFTALMTALAEAGVEI